VFLYVDRFTSVSGCLFSSCVESVILSHPVSGCVFFVARDEQCVTGDVGRDLSDDSLRFREGMLNGINIVFYRCCIVR
jgi:hypothetical protein